jgi:chromosome segregation ATPase
MSDQDQNKKDISEVIEEISNTFERDQKQISDRIKNNASELKDIKNLINVKTDLLTLRQEMVETSHGLNENLTKYKSTLVRRKASELDTITRNSQVRYQYHEKKDIVNARISHINQLIDMYENQIEFYKNSIQTVDKVLYGTKTVLEWYTQLGF